VPGGANDVFNPLLSAQHVGWSTSQYTGASSAALLGAGLLGLTLGGFLTARLGSRAMLAILFAAFAAHYAFVGLMRPDWDQSWLAYEVLWVTECLGIFVAVAMIPLAMQVCSPAVAATQFTIYMALANFGRPIGAGMAALQLTGDPRRLHFTIAAIMAASAVGTLFLSRRRVSAEVERKLAHGAGAGAAEN
jgi:MFS transporter, PAT family, beta-lactamase induction signal transducer AmpG